WATPYYVPPETIEGHVEDFRSDVYAFGAMLYHALAGKPPCDEESMATHVLREAKKKVQPLCTAASWLSPDTCAVVDKAMAYRPEDRFSSYEEMISRLQMALQRVQSGANAESEPAQHPRRQTKKRERLLFIGGGLGLLAVVG